MCRFNLIIIRDTNNEKALELLKTDGYGEFTIKMPGYKAFQKGYCNCGSFVGELIERKGIPYCEAKEIKKKEILDRLNKVKNLMTEPDYEILKEKFIHEREMLSKELEPYFYQMEQNVYSLDIEMNEVISQTDSNQKDGSVTDEEDYVTTLEALPGYKEKQDAYQELIHQNDLMEESTRYFISREEEEKFHKQSIPLTEIIKEREDLQEEDVEIIGINELMQSNVIDEVISRTEQDTGKKEMEEYNSYLGIFQDLLQLTPSLFFATIWSEPKELVTVNTVDIASLRIDDLAYLNYDEMICII